MSNANSTEHHLYSDSNKFDTPFGVTDPEVAKIEEFNFTVATATNFIVNYYDRYQPGEIIAENTEKSDNR